MAETLSAFYKERAAQPEPVDYVASERFKDAEGSPLVWRLRPLTPDEFDNARKRATKRRTIKGKSEETVDMGELTLNMCVTSVVHPNLKDAELQKNWDALGENDLLSRMLCVAGELTDLLIKVKEVSGFDRDPNEDIDEAKN